MKVKIKSQNKQIKEFLDPLSIIAGILIGGALSYLAKKFYAPVATEMTSAGNTIDKAGNELDAALAAEQTQEAASVRKQIVAARKKLTAKIKEIQKQAQEVESAAEMQQKPSVMISNAVEEYEDEIEELTVDVNLSEKTEQIIEQSKSKIKKAIALVKNVDNLMLILNKKDPKGLWASVISRYPIKNIFMDEKNWRHFAKLFADGSFYHKEEYEVPETDDKSQVPGKG